MPGVLQVARRIGGGTVRVLRPTLRIWPLRWAIETLPASQAILRAVSAETGTWEFPSQALLTTPGNPGGAIRATREPLRTPVIGRSDGTRASRPHPSSADVPAGT